MIVVRSTIIFTERLEGAREHALPKTIFLDAVGVPVERQIRIGITIYLYS
jgi:hypothetical protein